MKIFLKLTKSCSKDSIVVGLDTRKGVAHMSPLVRVAVQSLEKAKNKLHSTPKSIWDNMLVFSIEERKAKRRE